MKPSIVTMTPEWVRDLYTTVRISPRDGWNVIWGPPYGIEGAPARPEGSGSRLRAAWLVFTGQADALIWPGGQQ